VKVGVLDKGYVRLVDKLGDDLMVVNAARVSFNRDSAWKSNPQYKQALEEILQRHFHPEWERPGYDEGLRWELASLDARYRPPVIGELVESDRRLIHFLARNGHWSPFAHPKVHLEARAPLMVVNQWYRTAVDSCTTQDTHAWNEMSRRYVTEEPEFYVPEVWRSAPENKKQGSGEPVPDVIRGAADLAWRSWIAVAIGTYKRVMEYNIAPEQARLFLPAYALYTSFRWTASLATIARWLRERLADDSQWEIRQYAETVHQLVRPLFPVSFDALLGEVQ